MTSERPAARTGLTRRAVLGGGAALLAMACAPGVVAPTATGTPAPAATNEKLKALIDAASKEGGKLELTQAVYNSANLMKGLTESFKKTYGLDLSIVNTPNPNFVENAATVVQQYKAGRPASTDVFLGNEVHVPLMVDQDTADAIDWSWAPNIKKSLVEEGGRAVSFIADYRGFVYNPKVIKKEDIPTKLADLAPLSKKYALAMTPQVSGFDVVSSPEFWGEAKSREFIGQIAPNLKGLMNGSELQRVANGEFDIFGLDWGRAFNEQFKAKGGQLEWVLPADVGFGFYLYLLVPKNAPHPNLARLWVNHLLSREAQDLLYKDSFVDHPDLEGSQLAKVKTAYEASGRKVPFSDVAFMRRNVASFTTIRQSLQQVIRK
jgi:ABC-type Fe3+ transport system substrate-binding protein